MEARRDTLSSLKLCRFCLTRGDTLTSLYEKRASRNTVTLPLKILSCVSIEIFPSDKMPTYICTRCKFFLDISYDFKHLCRQADENILQYIQNAIPLTTMTWPASLLKLFRLANKTPAAPLMKTVIEGGATVHVTAQESDTDEEDDENVYNVKIGDGSDEGSKSARVKVITGGVKQDKGKPKRGKDPEESDKTELVRQEPMSELPEECWPCDQCEYTFLLQELLQLHKSQEHRERNVQCTQCEAKFFNISDMMTHQVTHAEQFNFKCIACSKKFTRLKMLKKHEKSVHKDLVQQPCPHCPATFLSFDELEAHQKKHARFAKRQYVCKLCKKRFHAKAMLQKHSEKMHNHKMSYSCKYCRSRFTSAAKLSRHVRTHGENRSYPCKYCNKSFVKSHHYTRHLRLKHRENIRTCRGPFGESDQYRCEQCEDSFATEDELIYHSAIHATQNLICPLCQEKFEDVDAVTTHIKSHVNGTEFMCDLCELVFTSKEKLDFHITVIHDEEIRSVPDLLQDESSMEMDVDEDEEDTGINVKELDDHMVVEIKKANEFLLSNTQDESEEKIDNTNSEESDSELALPDIGIPDALTIARKDSGKATLDRMPILTLGGASITKTTIVPPRNIKKVDSQTASILRKAEEIKKKVIQQPAPEPIAEKKEKSEKTNNKTENSNTVGASDKSLRLLEKELQELKRTNTRSEAVKTPAKPLETLRTRRAQIHTSTPKIRTPAEEKKTQVAARSPAVEKKIPERRVVTKENKEPKESKETKANNVSAKEEKEKEMKEKEAKEKEAKEKEKEAKEKEKEAKEKEKEIKEKEKEAKEMEKETKTKEAKEKETPKSVVKNGSEKINSEEGIRRSTRPSKIKDYAKMIRDRSQDSDENDESDDTDDEEYKEADKSIEARPRARRASTKTPAPRPAPAPAPAAPGPAPAPAPAPAPKKRGRPRKDGPRVAPKVRREEIEDDDDDVSESEKDNKSKTAAEKEREDKNTSETAEGGPSSAEEKTSTLVSPSGQTLKKIPIRALPPGVKAMPLPVNARTMGGEVCEMQIGKKVVKVQKIVMTKAEVEAMTKQGLVEMKDGTMVLKQGIKIPSSDSLKTGLVGEDASKESPSKKGKATPSRCDFGEDA